ncbi:MAG: PHP domain-containing protein [Solirubrobacteraceae bacterium]
MASDLPNAAIADALEELGDLYELDGAIIHRVMAYRTGAKAVREAAVSVAALAREGRAVELSGVGTTLQEKILALLETGSIPAMEKLRARIPAGLIDLTRLPGLGPKRARLLHSELGIDSLESLRAAAVAGRLRDVRGLGPKFEAGVIASLDSGVAERKTPRLLLPKALEIAETVIGELSGPRTRVLLAGEARRMVDSVAKIQLVAIGDRPPTPNIDVEVETVEPERLGTVLQRLTGSPGHNEALKRLGPIPDCATEAEVYERLGLAYIEPELRENRGELTAAAGGELPKLIETADLKGDLHCHTVASDGRNTIEQMALAARALGYEYLAITDHSASHGFGDDVSPEQLRRQIELVHEADAAIEGIHLLAGSEVNILPDGSLDYEDDLLAQLDWVIASVHTAFSMAEQAMTERMIAAIEHPLVDAIGHPTGRKIERRRPYALDIGAVIEAAACTGTMLEINANPDRRDLNELNARAAAQAGVRILIDSDAHGIERLPEIRWGLATARRAWLSAGDVANTRGWSEFAAMRKRARTTSRPTKR